MRVLLVSLLASLALALAGSAEAATIHADGGSGAAGHKLLWSLDFDDVADTITVTSTHTRFDGSAAIGSPSVAQIVLTRSNGQPLTLNLLTDGTVFDGGVANMLNTGPRTRTNVRLRVSADRAAAFSFSTNYTPPGA